MRDNKKLTGSKADNNKTYKQEVKSDQKVIPVNSARRNFKLNKSKKKILEFIKSYPNIRTKDIITEFNVLSNRTVKRNLTDLLRTGLIKKRVDNKAVYYYSSDWAF